MPVQKLNKAIRDEIFQHTLAAVRAEQLHLAGNCLEFAWHGYKLLKSYPGAPRTIIQAGTAQWPRLAEDDGVSPTHFSYEWNPDAGPTRLFLSGAVPLVERAVGHLQASLPEMHVWLACPDSGEVIDFTTGLWPQACRETIGEEWLAAPTRLPVDVWLPVARRRAVHPGSCRDRPRDRRPPPPGQGVPLTARTAPVSYRGLSSAVQ